MQYWYSVDKYYNATNNTKFDLINPNDNLCPYLCSYIKWPMDWRVYKYNNYIGIQYK